MCHVISAGRSKTDTQVMVQPPQERSRHPGTPIFVRLLIKAQQRKSNWDLSKRIPGSGFSPATSGPATGCLPLVTPAHVNPSGKRREVYKSEKINKSTQFAVVLKKRSSISIYSVIFKNRAGLVTIIRPVRFSTSDRDQVFNQRP